LKDADVAPWKAAAHLRMTLALYNDVYGTQGGSSYAEQLVSGGR
jgi:hypothetical protein